MKCEICNNEVNVKDGYSVIRGKTICNKCSSNNSGQINISSGNSKIDAAQTIVNKRIKWSY